MESLQYMLLGWYVSNQEPSSRVVKMINQKIFMAPPNFWHYTHSLWAISFENYFQFFLHVCIVSWVKQFQTTKQLTWIGKLCPSRRHWAPRRVMPPRRCRRRRGVQRKTHILRKQQPNFNGKTYKISMSSFLWRMLKGQKSPWTRLKDDHKYADRGSQ